MTKAAILISAILLFAGVATADSLTRGGSSNEPTLETPTLSTSTGADIRREDRRADRRADRGQAEDLSGPCDEAEHANDPRCTGAAGRLRADDDDHRNRGLGNGHDDDGSGHRRGNSGPGGGGGDDD